MLKKTVLCIMAAALCAVLALPGRAAEVESGEVYCFTADDLAPVPLSGICVMELPDPSVGTVMLGTRVVQPGDIFAADQLEQLTFLPVGTEEDAVATVGYLPIYENAVEQQVQLTISIRGKENKAPEAKDLTLETYKNIPNEGVLRVTDPEGEQLTYTVTRQPRRGDVVVNADGTFTYTPKKNKVGVDSFTFTAADPAGKVSREATVTVHILKPSQSDHYTDTEGLDCRFEAEWLRSSGLFTAEQVGGVLEFRPDKAVTRGEFLVMLLKAVDAPVESGEGWLQPYLAAAKRSGLIGDDFQPDAPVSGTEAALWLQSVLQLSAQTAVEELPMQELALQVGAEHGFRLSEETLTRGEAACVLYRAAELGRK